MSLFKMKNEIEKVEQEPPAEPVNISVIENVIDLITVASQVKCQFQLNLTLTIGAFKIDNDVFEDIKLSKTKKENPKLIITYHDVLMSNQTTINVENVTKVEFLLKYTDKGNDTNV